MYRVLLVGSENSEKDVIFDMIDWESLGVLIVDHVYDQNVALELVGELKIDIILTDVILNSGTGIDLVKLCKRRYANLEYIIVSESRLFEHISAFVGLDIIDYITKPVDEDELSYAIVRAITKIKNREMAENICRIVNGDDVANDNFVSKILSYLERRYKDKLTLLNVSKKFYISTWHLCKTIKRYTGKNFSEIINLIRVIKARSFLKETTLKVTEIAKRVGYNDLSYFTIAFKKITGSTPLKFRNSVGRIQSLI